MKSNDPIRVKKARTRLIAALIAAVVLLAVSGFGIFKMLGTPKSLTSDSLSMLAAEGSAEEEAPTGAQLGDYVEHEVNLIMKNFAEGTRGDTVRERYGVVPVDGKLVAFRFPQRWLESEQAIVDATQELLNGTAQYIDKYIVVRGTVQAMPEDVSGELYSWFADNQEWMQQAGLISSEQDAAASLADYMVSVDSVGKLPVGAVVGLTAAAGVCLLYALYELIRILLKGYAVKQTEAEADSAESAETETASEAEEDIEVEITEADPETGEDVTDLEVEIVEEETAKEETTEDADA
ncbi:MAG: hypothetical protein IJH52_04965 [Oscillospiraceae bacterium]|nr:hypothetical protein [Oscillospiraceae bacterium]